MMCGAQYAEGERIPGLRLCCLIGKFKSYNTMHGGNMWAVPIPDDILPDISERMIEHWLNYMDLCHDHQHTPP